MQSASSDDDDDQPESRTVPSHPNTLHAEFNNSFRGARPVCRDGASLALPSAGSTRGAAAPVTLDASPDSHLHDCRNLIAPPPSDDEILVTMVPPGFVQDAIQAKLNAIELNEEFADISSLDGVMKVCDEISFKTFAARLKSSIISRRCVGFIGMHPGLSSRQQKDVKAGKAKEMLRYGAALLVRLFFIAELCINGGLPFLLVLPWASADETVRDSDLFRKIAHQVNITRFASSESLRHEVVTNYREIDSTLDIKVGLATFVDAAVLSS